MLFEIFNEFMIAIGNYERLDSRHLVKVLESVSATFITLDQDVLGRYRVFLVAEIERENARGAFVRASVLEDFTDLVD